jgi:uncharacterized protein (DUF608 family)
MGYGIGKKDNEYARALRDIDAPKTVWMAIAFAMADFCTGLEMDDEKIREKILNEWQALHDNGIVPQKPRKAVRS